MRAVGARAALQPAEVAVIEIQVADTMRYTPAVIDARPGERLRIVLRSVGKMPKNAMSHTLVLLKRGTDPKSFVEKSSMAPESEFIAPGVGDQLIVATALIGAGETSEITFEAPTQAGTYTFVCTFPDHFNLGMRGQPIVK